MHTSYFSLPGSFGNKKIEWEIFYTKTKNPNLTINIHGVYNHKDDVHHRRFAEFLSKNNYSNVVLFSTSRNAWISYEDINFRQKMFGWKNFHDELLDAEKVFEYILQNTKSLFWYNKENTNIILNGNSLGGVIAFFLAEKYNQIQNISSVGTGFRTIWENRPIMNTFPSEKTYAEVLKKFSGKFLMHEWEFDHKFSREQFEKLWNLVGTQNKKHIFYPWANHTFTKFFDTKTFDLYHEITKNFIEYFLKISKK